VQKESGLVLRKGEKSVSKEQTDPKGAQSEIKGECGGGRKWVWGKGHLKKKSLNYGWG